MPRLPVGEGADHQFKIAGYGWNVPYAALSA